MGDPKDDDSGEKPNRYKDGVRHDQRGNAVWQWAADSGRHLLESTSALLKRLEVPGLKLEEDATDRHEKVAGKTGVPQAAPREAGYDPYGAKRAAVAPPRPGAKLAPVAKPAPAAKPMPTVKPAPGAGAATKPAAAPPARQSSLLRRLFGKD